jgi:hypothetical protein
MEVGFVTHYQLMNNIRVLQQQSLKFVTKLETRCLMEPEFLLFAFSFKADFEKAPENLQMELINLPCDTNLNQKFSETKLQDFYYYLPK